MRPLQLLALCVLPALAGDAPARPGDRLGLAPDGRPGFGAELELGDLLQLLRTPDETEKAFLEELGALGRDVGVLVAVTEGFYRDRGYFELLDPLEDPTLANLHEAYSKYALDPASVATRPQRIGTAFARMFLDTRFRVRLDLVSDWTREAGEVSDGLAVLQGAAKGYVILDGLQASNVVARIDLAAAALRAMRSDLESLREPLETARVSGVSPERTAGFLAMFDIGDRNEREAALAKLYAHEKESEDRMRALLFTERLRQEAQERFAWRTNSDFEARRLLEEARAASPDREGSDDVSREVAKLSKSRRRKLARELAVGGLALDPFDQELAWLAGTTSSYVYGELETASHFDRFLVLRGILYYDDPTYAGRELTERERIALKYVQEIDRRATGTSGL